MSSPGEEFEAHHPLDRSSSGGDDDEDDDALVPLAAVAPAPEPLTLGIPSPILSTSSSQEEDDLAYQEPLWACPCLTMGCNAVYGRASPGCPYVAFCGPVIPGTECFIWNREERPGRELCVAPCPLATAICLPLYIPAWLLSFLFPGWCNVGPACWGCPAECPGGLGYVSDDWT
eukprot:NODE_3961_length_888_cov_30.334923_g3649_i0.p1 GENE.NODE_3961_length_888_cov_30.334923_g3649_i0~~NODE_3961_length_888_cov_30.334923_g3649_i0.p1  ORF type:complete len:174 (-),score=11.71 NODE_3961_length_888_cov_30.334923_g3649_i0:220-741(-)